MWKHLVSLILSEDAFSDNISLKAKVPCSEDENPPKSQ